MELYVDFQDEIIDKNIHNDEKVSLYKEEYDDQTMTWYKNMRIKKYDAISHEIFDCDDSHVFKFEYMWDPLTGERLNKDPYGGLCFHPDDLIRIFYKQRLNGLWKPPTKELEGYYGEAVGSGENIEAKGNGMRGMCPEVYLFRLPIADCYLKPDSDQSIIYMGPKLTNDEVAEIDRLAEAYHKNNYMTLYKKNVLL